MKQATIHTESTAPHAPTRQLIARIAALVLLAVMAALTVQSFFTEASAKTPAHVAPAVARPASSSLCLEFSGAHFVFVDARGIPTPTSTCISQTMPSFAPVAARPSAPSLCREFPNAPFVFIDARAAPTVASACTNQMLSV